jgi:squalene-associated FAD-dependent desaturase
MSGSYGTIHIAGAGLAGLSAAVHLTAAGRTVELYEASTHAGGRCRSYFDRDLDAKIDNGNHLFLTCNTAALFYLDLIGATRTVNLPKRSVFPFMDVKTGERWQININDGKFPFWIFNPKSRVPGTRPAQYLQDGNNLMRANEKATLDQVLNKDSVLYKRFWAPLAVSIMNTQGFEMSAKMFADVLREVFSKGGKGCRPLTVKEGLSETFVDPAIRYIESRGGKVHFGKRLRTVEKAEGEIRKMIFADGELAIQQWDWVVLALPPWVTADVMRDYPTPNAYRGIVNAHFRVSAPTKSEVGLTGIVGGTAEWVFEKEGVVSTTTSAAEKIIDKSSEELAALLWKDVAKLYGLDEGNMPICRVVKEKRATFAATPDQIKKRPKIEVKHGNLVVCGDWVDTGLPSTIEGAIRAGRDVAVAILPPAERRFSRQP